MIKSQQIALIALQRVTITGPGCAELTFRTMTRDMYYAADEAVSALLDTLECAGPARIARADHHGDSLTRIHVVGLSCAQTFRLVLMHARDTAHELMQQCQSNIFEIGGQAQ